MKQLPMDDWQVYYDGGKVLRLAMHSNNGYLHWTKVQLLNPLENSSGNDDLKGIIVNAVDRALVA